MTPLPSDISQRKRILFVDDDQHLLDGLRRGLHAMRDEWDMRFALGGIAALSLMREQPVDVVVSDMRMPEMNGRELLLEVKKRHPQSVRFILSGYADSASVMKVTGIAHQYLAKPCNAVALKTAIERATNLRRLVEDKGLARRVGAVESLPSLPESYRQIVECLQSPDPELADVARIISADISMTTMVLKLANSAFFGARQLFRTADRAVSFLGLETIAGLVLANSIFNDFSAAERSGLNVEQLWHHSLQTGTGLKALARYEKWSPEDVDEAFLAGVLHDVGKLVLATQLPSSTGHLQAPSSTSVTTDVWEADHAAAGAYLLGLWGFSDRLVEAIAFHHAPSAAVGNKLGLAGMLHVADCLSTYSSCPAKVTEMGIERNYLETLGLVDQLKDWQVQWDKSAG